jgi:hypothetical protein
MAKSHGQRIRKHGPAAATTPAGGHRSATGGNPPEAGGPARNGNLILIPAVAAAVFLFWYFHLLTLDQLAQLAGGLPMPDSLPGGYNAAYVDQLRAAMDADALGQLNYVHKTAGTLFPLIFGIAWLLLIQLATDRPGLRRLLWVPVLLFVAVDLWENFAIDAMLGGGSPDAGTVARASTLTVARWALFALSCAAGLVAVFVPRRRAAVSG